MPRRKTHDEFVNQVKHLPITVTGKYIGNRQRIGVLCEKCFHKWEMRVDHLLSGKGCPECARMRSRKTTDEYRVELSEFGIKLTSEYVNRKTPVSLECEVCKHQWSAIPESCRKSCPACSAIAAGEKARKPPSDYYIKDGVAFISIGDSIVEIDECDLTLLDRAINITPKGYVCMCGQPSAIYIHKLIMDKSGCLVDHKDRNPLNNRRSNLRYATRSQNAMNSVVRRDSSSGLRGISYNNKRRKWAVRICKDGNDRYLGSFDNVEIAVGVRQGAELEMFGEYSPLSN